MAEIFLRAEKEKTVRLPYRRLILIRTDKSIITLSSIGSLPI